jgi:hypothetical protein
MAIEIEVCNITPFDNDIGQGTLATVQFKDYDVRHEDIAVNVIIPLDKEAPLKEIEERILEKAKQQLKDLVSGF